MRNCLYNIHYTYMELYNQYFIRRINTHDLYTTNLYKKEIDLYSLIYLDYYEISMN